MSRSEGHEGNDLSVGGADVSDQVLWISVLPGRLTDTPWADDGRLAVLRLDEVIRQVSAAHKGGGTAVAAYNSAICWGRPLDATLDRD